MKERPILFNGEMIRAILAGTKTQTRRIAKPPTGAVNPEWFWEINPAHRENAGLLCPYGVPGDRLWVRETWKALGDIEPCACKCPAPEVLYAATDAKKWMETGLGNWKPSIFMPRWASRLTLEVTAVRVERVQQITDADAIAEGVGAGFQMNAGYPDYGAVNADGVCTITMDTAAASFGTLWDSINAKRGFGWDVNPWVWVVEFKRVTT